MKRTLLSLSILLLFSAGTVFPQPVGPFTPDSLTRALWHLNETSGSIVHDTLGFNNGLAVGTTIVPGRFGNARSFNGSGDYISFPASPDFDFDTASFTIDLWFKTTAESGMMVRRAMAPPPGVPSPSPGFLIAIDHGNLVCQIGNWPSPWPDTIITIYSTAEYNDGAWHLATMVRDRASATLSLYADGVLAAPPATDHYIYPISSDRPLTIGCWESYLNPDWFNGTIDDIRLTCARIVRRAVQIEAHPLSLDFGMVRLGRTDTLSIGILNKGYHQELSVTSITSSNSVFTMSTEGMVIPPGGIDTLRIYYTPVAVQSDIGSLSIACNDLLTPLLRIPLSGKGIALTESPIIGSIVNLYPYYYDQVRIIWYRSIYDTLSVADPVTAYSIWRRADGVKAARSHARESPSLPPNSTLIDPLWDFIETVPAMRFERYAAIVPRLYDYSGPDSWSVFMVAAHTKNMQIFCSAPDSIQWDPVTTVNAPGQQQAPDGFALRQNYPNPFNPTTTITYAVPHEGHITLSVYDIIGREIVRLVDQQQSVGEYSVVWNGKDVSSGIYFYRLTAPGTTLTKKMLLVR